MDLARTVKPLTENPTCPRQGPWRFSVCKASCCLVPSICSVIDSDFRVWGFHLRFSYELTQFVVDCRISPSNSLWWLLCYKILHYIFKHYYKTFVFFLPNLAIAIILSKQPSSISYKLSIQKLHALKGVYTQYN